MRQTSRSRARVRTVSTSSPGEGPVVRAGTRTIYTAGRPPWYDSHGQLKEPFVIGKHFIINISILMGHLLSVVYYRSTL